MRKTEQRIFTFIAYVAISAPFDTDHIRIRSERIRWRICLPHPSLEVIPSGLMRASQCVIGRLECYKGAYERTG